MRTTSSAIAGLNRKFVKGLAVNQVGYIAHATIMARARANSAVIGTNKGTADINNGVLVIVDGLAEFSMSASSILKAAPKFAACQKQSLNEILKPYFPCLRQKKSNYM